MNCPKCDTEMDRILPDCSYMICCNSSKPYWLCPNCGEVVEIV